MNNNKSTDFLDYYDSEKYAERRLKKLKGHFSKNYTKYGLFYFNKLRLKNNEKVLDVGCGVGKFVGYAVEKGAEGYGIDFSPSVIKLAKANFKGQFVVGDITKMPYQNNFFDKIFCDEVYEHLSLDEGQKMVNEIYRVLKPGGRFLIKTPNVLSNYGFRVIMGFHKLVRKGKFSLKTCHDFAHIHEYKKSEIPKRFRRFNYNCYERTYIPNHKLLSEIFNIWPLRKIFGVKLIIEGQKPY